MRPMLKIDISEKNKLSSGCLAHAKSVEDGGVYIFRDNLTCNKNNNPTARIRFKVSKFIVIYV